jgi:rhodanese-related sulfurtransferase
MSFLFVGCAQNTQDKKNNLKEAVVNDKVVSLISPKDLQSKLGDIQLVDVRKPEEYAAGHIDGAENINFYDEDFMKVMLSKLDKSKPVYVYCRSGHRSGLASSKLKAEGFTKIYDLEGGILNWEKQDLKTKK